MANFFGSLISRCGLKKLHGFHICRNLSMASKTFPSNSIDEEEIKKFNSSSDQWWSNSQYALLRSMNTIRVPIIRDGILSINGIATKKPLPLEGFKILDVGCGGGILSEPLTRLGATVTGLDPVQDSIEVATLHASSDDTIKHRLNYVCGTVENLVENSADRYDVVVCSEVIEHVANPQTFVNSCFELVKDGGSMFFTTINRTSLSYAMAILMAEYVLNLVPRGIHDWNKFVTPKELSDMLKSLNCRVVSIQGYVFNPATKKWNYCSNSDVMYALHAVK